jgi:hypothetical protein
VNWSDSTRGEGPPRSDSHLDGLHLVPGEVHEAQPQIMYCVETHVIAKIQWIYTKETVYTIDSKDKRMTTHNHEATVEQPFFSSSSHFLCVFLCYFSFFPPSTLALTTFTTAAPRSNCLPLHPSPAVGAQPRGPQLYITRRREKRMFYST